MSDDLIERLKHRADTMNGASPVGAGDGNTYACGYYGMIDRKLDRALLDALTAKDSACGTAAEAELERARRALEAGKKLANVAFNIHQMGAVDASALQSLKEAQVAWDDALLSAS